MPTIGIKRDVLFKALGQTYTQEEFDHLCFQFGIELDEVVKEVVKVGNKEEEHEVYKIEIPANRYDLLCVEGLSLALKVFQEKLPCPTYRAIVPPQGCQRLVIKPSTEQIRPYAVAAVLRNITFGDDERYKSFIDLQDKLHQNLCRRRTLVAIGTHDLDTIEGPFTYEALDPTSIEFKPLNQTKEYTAADLMDLYAKDSHLKQYLPIIKDSPVYPVIKDKNGVVLSLPPIINGEHSKISKDTKNVFIECTATDLHKASVVLDTLVTMFSCYCSQPFTVEKCEVEKPDGSVQLYPTLENRVRHVDPQKVNSLVGINETPDRIAALLTKMCLDAHVDPSGLIKVHVPPTRHDVIHDCDVYEDVAIAYGYNNIERIMPKTFTIASELPLNKLTDKLRHEMGFMGFTEALPFVLCSKEDVSVKIRKSLTSAVQISNPKALEFQVARTTLLPGLLKTIVANKHMPLPMKLFEVSDVVLKDPESDVGARNFRRLIAVNYDKTPGFELIHGVLERLMQLLDIKREPLDGYALREVQDETYFPGRCVEVLVAGRRVGLFGVVHPEVNAAFELPYPCAALEINIEPFL